MGVDRLRLKENQPFYHVLVGDGSNRYAAQENLSPIANGVDIGHPEVGKHFTGRRGRHYWLNAEAASRYPDDEGYRERKHPEK